MSDHTNDPEVPEGDPVDPADSIQAQVRAWADATAASATTGSAPVTAVEVLKLVSGATAGGGSLAAGGSTGDGRSSAAAVADASNLAGASDEDRSQVSAGSAGGGRSDVASGRWEAGRRRKRGRALAVAAAVLLVLGVAVVVLSAIGDEPGEHVAVESPRVSGADGDGGDEAPSGSVDSTGDVSFRVVGTFETGVDSDRFPMGTLRSATTSEELQELWGSVAGDALVPFPVVDFEREVVVSITIPDDACAPTLERFEREAETISPVFVEPPGGCRDPLIPKTFVVAIDWSKVGSRFTLFLPGQPTYGFEDNYLEVTGPGQVHPTIAEAEVRSLSPECASVEAFAEVLAVSDAGSDYQPTYSPADLAERSDLVIVGSLDPGVSRITTSSRFDLLSFQVAPQRVAGPSADGVAGASTITILVTDGQSVLKGRGADVVELEDDLPVGAPVVVFATYWEPADGFVASIEGFATACAGGPPIGAVGSMGEWAELETLEDLIHAIS